MGIIKGLSISVIDFPKENGRSSVKTNKTTQLTWVEGRGVFDVITFWIIKLASLS